MTRLAPALGLALLVAALLIAPPAHADDDNIGVVNVELLLAYLPAAKSVEKQLEAVGASLDKSLKVKQAYYQSKVAEFYEKSQGNRWASEAEQRAAVEELQKLEAELQKASQDAEQRLMVKQQELMKPILDKIQTAIDAVAKEGGFTYLLNQTSGMNLVYVHPDADMNERVANKLGITIPRDR